MEMSIDEQIKALEYLKKCGIFPFSDTRTGIVITDEYVDGAIDTMRKYQKIEQIMDQEQTQWGVVKDTWLYKEIREVLEDGNNTTNAGSN